MIILFNFIGVALLYLIALLNFYLSGWVKSIVQFSKNVLI
jgi:hypothetical protein